MLLETLSLVLLLLTYKGLFAYEAKAKTFVLKAKDKIFSWPKPRLFSQDRLGQGH